MTVSGPPGNAPNTPMPPAAARGWSLLTTSQSQTLIGSFTVCCQVAPMSRLTTELSAHPATTLPNTAKARLTSRGISLI